MNNHDYKNLLTPQHRHRAEIASDGSVSLIAEPASVTIRIHRDLDDQSVEVVDLSAAAFAKLSKMSAAPDKVLTYDGTRRMFGIKRI